MGVLMSLEGWVHWLLCILWGCMLILVFCLMGVMFRCLRVRKCCLRKDSMYVCMSRLSKYQTYCSGVLTYIKNISLESIKFVTQLLLLPPAVTQKCSFLSFWLLGAYDHRVRGHYFRRSFKLDLMVSCHAFQVGINTESQQLSKNRSTSCKNRTV